MSGGNIYEDTYASIQELDTVSTERASQKRPNPLTPRSLLTPPTTAKNTEDPNVPGNGENRYEAIPPGTFERENGYTKFRKQQKKDLPQPQQPPHHVNSNSNSSNGEPQVKHFQVQQPTNLKSCKTPEYDEVGTTIHAGQLAEEDSSMKRGYDRVGSVLE